MADKPTDAATFVSRGLSGLRGADMRQIVKVLRDPEVRAELVAVVREALETPPENPEKHPRKRPSK